MGPLRLTDKEFQDILRVKEIEKVGGREGGGGGEGREKDKEKELQ